MDNWSILPASSEILIFVWFSSKLSFVNNGIVDLVLSINPIKKDLCCSLISFEFWISFLSLAIFLFSALMIDVLLNSLSSIGNKYFSDNKESFTFPTWHNSLADWG